MTHKLKGLPLATAGLSGIDQQQNSPGNSTAPAGKQATASKRAAAYLRAELIGSDACRCGSITTHSHTPVLAMCRQLLAHGIDPDCAVEIYRADFLALRIRSIEQAAKLAVREDHGPPEFCPYRPLKFGTVSPRTAEDDAAAHSGGSRMTAPRRKLPNRRFSETFAVRAQGMGFTATISRFDDGQLAEIFLSNHRAGSDADANACDAAVIASIALQFGVPLEKIRKALARDGRGRARTPLGAALDLIAERPP